MATEPDLNIRPTRIPGRWRDGFALDYHTVSSDFLGYDEFGNPRFDTKRTQLGELLYRLKYQADNAAAQELIDVAATFVSSSWKPGVEVVVPVPPSRVRSHQPVLTLVQGIGGRLGIPVALDCVKRVKDVPELKNVSDYDERLRLLAGAHTFYAAPVKGRKVLLFDDLFRSGATMNAISAGLYDDAGAAEVYAMTITRTRSKA